MLSAKFTVAPFYKYIVVCYVRFVVAFVLDGWLVIVGLCVCLSKHTEHNTQHSVFRPTGNGSAA